MTYEEYLEKWYKKVPKVFNFKRKVDGKYIDESKIKRDWKLAMNIK